MLFFSICLLFFSYLCRELIFMPEILKRFPYIKKKKSKHMLERNEHLFSVLGREFSSVFVQHYHYYFYRRYCFAIVGLDTCYESNQLH